MPVAWSSSVPPRKVPYRIDEPSPLKWTTKASMVLALLV
jgi:hypothetical protein